MISSTCVRSAATRTAPGPPGTATYMSRRPTVSLRRVADARLALRAPACTSGRPAWFSIGGQRARREIAVGANAAGPVHERDAVAVLRGQPVHRLVPRGRIGRQRLANQPGLVLEAAGDVALEVAPERALGAPEQDQHGEDQDERPCRAPAAAQSSPGARSAARCRGTGSRSRAPSRSVCPASPSFVRSRWTCMSTVRVWMSGCASHTVSSSCGRVCTRPRRSTSVSRSLYSVAVRLSSWPPTLARCAERSMRDRAGGQGATRP